MCVYMCVCLGKACVCVCEYVHMGGLGEACVCVGWGCLNVCVSSTSVCVWVYCGGLLFVCGGYVCVPDFNVCVCAYAVVYWFVCRFN